MNDDSTTAVKVAPNRPSGPRAWCRHATAAVVAVALNAGLLVLLTTWREASPRVTASPLHAVPLRVVEAEAAKVELAQPSDVVAAVPPPSPTVSLPLPALPQHLPTAAGFDAPPGGRSTLHRPADGSG